MKILLCISRLPYAQSTMAWGNLLGLLPATQLTLLTIYQSTSEQSEAAATLDTVRAQLTAPVVAAELRRGRVVDEIVQEAERGYDLILVGDHQVQRLRDYWRAPRTVRLAKKAPTSLLVVKSERAAMKRVLVATGAHEHSRPAIQMGLALANAAGATADVIYVRAQAPGMFQGLREMHEPEADLLQADTPVAQHLRWVSRQLASVPAGGVLQIRTGLVVDAILNELSAGGYDLLVVGAHTSDTFIEMLFSDDILPELIQRSPGSVLLVRSET